MRLLHRRLLLYLSVLLVTLIRLSTQLTYNQCCHAESLDKFSFEASERSVSDAIKEKCISDDSPDVRQISNAAFSKALNNGCNILHIPVDIEEITAKKMRQFRFLSKFNLTGKGLVIHNRNKGMAKLTSAAFSLLLEKGFKFFSYVTNYSDSASLDIGSNKVKLSVLEVLNSRVLFNNDAQLQIDKFAVEFAWRGKVQKSDYDPLIEKMKPEEVAYSHLNIDCCSHDTMSHMIEKYLTKDEYYKDTGYKLHAPTCTRPKLLEKGFFDRSGEEADAISESIHEIEELCEHEMTPVTTSTTTTSTTTITTTVTTTVTTTTTSTTTITTTTTASTKIVYIIEEGISETSTNATTPLPTTTTPSNSTLDPNQLKSSSIFDVRWNWLWPFVIAVVVLVCFIFIAIIITKKKKDS